MTTTYDDIKIRGLMVYYHHWGNEQNKKRKVIQGLKKITNPILEYTDFALEMVEDRYDNEDNIVEVLSFHEHRDNLKNDPSLLNECLLKLFQDEYFTDPQEMLENCQDFSDFLLKDCHGDMEFNIEIPDEEDLLEKKKNSLDYFCDMSEEAMDILYDETFTEENILSVEAIVAIL